MSNKALLASQFAQDFLNYRKIDGSSNSRFIDSLQNRNIVTHLPMQITTLITKSSIFELVCSIPIIDAFSGYNIVAKENVSEEELSLVSKKFSKVFQTAMEALKFMKYYGASIIIIEDNNRSLDQEIKVSKDAELNYSVTSRWGISLKPLDNKDKLRTFNNNNHFQQFQDAEYFYIGEHKIHHSRVIILNNNTNTQIDSIGINFDLYGGWGASALDSCFDTIVQYQNAMNSVNDKIRSSRFYTASTTPESVKDDLFRDKMSEAFKKANTNDVLLIDKQTEVQAHDTPFSDTGNIFDLILNQVSFVTQIPRSRLLLEDGSSASLSSDGSENEGERHYRRILAQVQNQYFYLFENLLKLTTLSLNGTDDMFEFSLDSNKTLSPKEKIEQDNQVIDIALKMQQLNLDPSSYLKKYDLIDSEDHTSLEKDLDQDNDSI